MPSPTEGPVQTKLAGASALPGSSTSADCAPGGTAKVTPWKVRGSQPAGSGAGAGALPEPVLADGAVPALGALALGPADVGAADRLGAEADGDETDALAAALPVA